MFKKRSQKHKSLVNSDQTNSIIAQLPEQPYYENALPISTDLPVVEEVIYDVADSLGTLNKHLRFYN